MEIGEVLITALIISMVIQGLFFVVAASLKTDKVTDLSYGLSFIALIWYVVWRMQTTNLFSWLLVIAVNVWGLRLAGYLLIRIMKMKKDDRFNGIRESWIKFGQFWFFQGVSVWIILIPVILVLIKPQISLNWVSLLGLGVWFSGLVIETVADQQKFMFKQNSRSRDRWIDSGLWKYSRHPNYFGEMLVWWGLFVAVLPNLRGVEFLGVIGPAYITFLLLKVSGIPPLEKKYAKKYAGDTAYMAYKQRTHLLLPIPRL